MASSGTTRTDAHVLRPKFKPFWMRAVPLGMLALFFISRTPETQVIGIGVGVFVVLEAIALRNSSITCSSDGFVYRNMNRTTSHRWSDLAEFVLVEQRMLFGLIPVNRYLGWNFAPGYKTNRLLAVARRLARSFRLADAMIKPMGFHVPTLVVTMNQFLEMSRSRERAAIHAAQARALAELPTIVVSRRARQFGGTWQEARSWFGGGPRLGSIPWPRNRSGVPMNFVAQFDLTEIAAIAPGSPLPTSGSLAFFLGDRPVVYIPPQSGLPMAKAPTDAVTLDEAGYGERCPCCLPGDPSTPQCFPYWPVDFTALGTFPSLDDATSDDVEERREARYAEQLATVDEHFVRRQFPFDARDAFTLVSDASPLCWWHSAIHLAHCLRVACESATTQPSRSFQAVTVGGGNGSRMVEEDNGSRLHTFRTLATEMLEWTRDRDPWILMQKSEIERLKHVLTRLNADFPEFTRWPIPLDLNDLATFTLKVMATAEDRAYASIPADIRRLINQRYLLPTDHWHQIFGESIDVQGNAVDETQGNCLLLRLTNDDMMHWNFGDNSVYHFYISPQALAAGNWNAARMTCECH